MPNEKQIIRTLTEPTIILDDLQFLDTETGTGKVLGKPETAYKPSKQYGGAFPLIKLNNYIFPSDTVKELRISSADIRPYVSIVAELRDKSFYSTAFPKDGDVVSIFIRGKVDPFKPIRNDYEITSVYVDNVPGGGETTPDTLHISGVLKIPDFDAVKCFSVKGTSFKTMMKVATDLKLGFASNEVDTSDSQTWLCPNEKVKNFLDETVLASWKDENSFFSYFIDHYYIMNFVNVEYMYSEQPDFEQAISLLRMSSDYLKDSEISGSLGKLVLSNWEEISQSQLFITQHSLINNSASINLSHGYKRYSQFYDGLLKENQSFFVDPKTTPGKENDHQLLKGRPNENQYLKQINTKWMGVQYGKDGENCHPKYNYAKVTNYQNNTHLEKMGLKIKLANPNFNLRRMQTVPVVIVIGSDYGRKKINEPIDESNKSSSGNSNEPNKTQPAVDVEKLPFTVDKTMSGFYVLHTIDYIFENGNFYQECTLFRREWPTPPQSH